MQGGYVMLVYSKAEIDKVLKACIELHATQIFPSKDDRLKINAIDCIMRYISRDCKIYWADNDDLYTDETE